MPFAAWKWWVCSSLDRASARWFVSATFRWKPTIAALLQQRKTVSEFLDVRSIIEPSLARRAALHASREQLAELQSIVDQQEAKANRDELTTEEDSSFHYAIAVAADNSVMLKLVHVLMDLLHETRERSLQVGGRQQSRSLPTTES